MFKERALKKIFIVSLAIAVLFPLINIYVIYPLFIRLLIHETKINAVHVAEHLKFSALPEGDNLERPLDFRMEPERLKEDFDLLKITLYSETGEMLYSTDPEDAGKTVRPALFSTVALGETYTEVVEFDTDSEEGDGPLEVLRTYVPIINRGKFLGVFEVCCDITWSKRELDNTVFYSSVIPFASAGGFMSIIVLLLLKANRSIRGCSLMEGELRRQRDTLEEAVMERTSELREANEDLEREIAERRHAEAALMRSERFLSSIFDSIHDPFCIFDRDFGVVKANEGYARLKNMEVEDILGKTCYEAMEGGKGICDNCVVEKTIMSGDPCAKDKKLVLPDGSEMWLEIFTYPIFDEKGEISYIIEYTRDITERKITEKERLRLIGELEHLSRVDSLTGLLNRRALIEKIDHEMTRASRYHTELSLIICDIDFFKDLNDTYGHIAGDNALRQVAETLRRLLRKSDIAGRYGGDEFMIILPETDMEGARVFAERIRVEIEGLKLDDNQAKGASRVRLSLGVSEFHQGMENSDDLIMPADDALYKSKQAGKNRVTLAGSHEQMGLSFPPSV